MEDYREKVGSNLLIIQNIVKHCNKETKLNCRLVNSTWYTEALKYLAISNRENGRSGTFEALLDKPLNPFRNITIYYCLRPQLLDYFGPTLKSLHLKEVCFSDVTELCNVLFNAFPNMKELILDRVAVKKQGKHGVSESLNGITQGTTSLETLTIMLGDHRDWEYEDEEPGLLALGLRNLFQKFSEIKKLKYDVGDYRTSTDFLGELLQAKVIPTSLEFMCPFESFESAEEYLTKYKGRLLHVHGSSVPAKRKFGNVIVCGWLSARMDGANWRTFGKGTFENLLTLELVLKDIECFDFLARMPVLQEIKFVENELDLFWLKYMDEGVTPVLDLERNPPCTSVRVLDFCGRFPDYRQELFFHVFPNVTRVNLSCERHFLSEIVTRWGNIINLHLRHVKGADAAFITKNVMRLKDLENFQCYSKDVIFGDSEGKEFLFHSKLVYLRLGRVSMSPLMICLLKRKLVEFESSLSI